MVRTKGEADPESHISGRDTRRPRVRLAAPQFDFQELFVMKRILTAVLQPIRTSEHPDTTQEEVIDKQR